MSSPRSQRSIPCLLFGAFCTVLGLLWLFFTWTQPGSPAQMGYRLSWGMVAFGLGLLGFGWILYFVEQKKPRKKK